MCGNAAAQVRQAIERGKKSRSDRDFWEYGIKKDFKILVAVLEGSTHHDPELIYQLAEVAVFLPKNPETDRFLKNLLESVSKWSAEMPNHPSIARLYGAMLIRDGRYKDAIERLETARACRILKDLPREEFWLALAHAKAGNKVEAIQWRHNALSTLTPPWEAGTGPLALIGGAAIARESKAFRQAPWEARSELVILDREVKRLLRPKRHDSRCRRSAAQWRRGAAGEVFELHRERLKRMVRLRLDRRLQGRLDASDVLQEAFLDVQKKAADFAQRNMTSYLWLRLITSDDC